MRETEPIEAIGGRVVAIGDNFIDVIVGDKKIRLVVECTVVYPDAEVDENACECWMKAIILRDGGGSRSG